MSGMNRERVKELLSHASLLPRQEREAFIRKTAGTDSDSAAEAIDLLSTLDDTEFMSNPTGAGIAATIPHMNVPGEGPGTRIDRYKLLQLIGEGGFGSVFMAEQVEPVHRKVALKIIKAGMDTKQVIARFEAERQALALMDHPNIARVLDAGATKSGRLYFVMELVRGEPCTNYCDRERLPVRKRLELFRDVCNAVQHAHQKGIIHRDIKPSNVLVTVADGEPLPKVIDFGIAKATASRLTDKTLFTEMHQLIGTPEYMSPEQAEVTGVDIDTRSDIYSLGVLLYELLVGSTPLEGTSLRSTPLAEVQRLIREVEPPRPSMRLATLASSPQNVPFTPQRKADRDSDSSTANDIAWRRQSEPMALNRLLRGDLDWIVLKCLEKDRRRRYPTASALAHDVDLFLANEPVSAIPPSTRYKLAKFVQRNRAGVAAVAAIVVVLVLGMIGTTIGLVWAVSEARESARQAERANREALAARNAETLANQRAEETKEVADFQAKMLLGFDAEVIGRGIQSEFRNQLSTSLSRQQVGDWPHRRLRTPDEVATALAEFETETSGVSMAEVARHVLDDFVLSRASEAASQQFESQPLVQAQIDDALGASYRVLGLYDAAELHYRRALEIHRRELGEHEKVAVDLNNVASILYDRGEYKDAEPMCVEALAIHRKVSLEDNVNLIKTMHNLASLARALGDLDSAEKQFRELLEIARRTIGEESTEVADVLNNLAGIRYARGDFVEAESMFREGLTIQQELLGDDHCSTGQTLHNLAGVTLARGDIENAEPMFLEVLAIRRRRLGNQHPDVSQTLNSLGLLYKAKGEFDEAASYYRECLAIRRVVFGDDNLDLAITLNNLAVMLRDQGDYAGAEPLYREAIAILERKLPAGHAQIASGRTGLARVLVKSSSDPKFNSDERAARLSEAEKLVASAESDLSQSQTANSQFKKRLIETQIDLYEALDAGSPDIDYTERVAELKVRLSEMDKKP